MTNLNDIEAIESAASILIHGDKLTATASISFTGQFGTAKRCSAARYLNNQIKEYFAEDSSS